MEKEIRIKSQHLLNLVYLFVYSRIFTGREFCNESARTRRFYLNNGRPFPVNCGGENIFNAFNMDMLFLLAEEKTHHFLNDKYFNLFKKQSLNFHLE